MKETPLDIARKAWGSALPDWVEVLAIECGRTSANRVADKLDRSSSVISQVLHRKYSADMRHIEERVRGVYLDGKLHCPAIGEMAVHACQDWRQKSRTFAAGNPMRTRMFRACRMCPRNQTEADDATR